MTRSRGSCSAPTQSLCLEFSNSLRLLCGLHFVPRGGRPEDYFRGSEASFLHGFRYPPNHSHQIQWYKPFHSIMPIQWMYTQCIYVCVLYTYIYICIYPIKPMQGVHGWDGDVVVTFHTDVCFFKDPQNGASNPTQTKTQPCVCVYIYIHTSACVFLGAGEPLFQEIQKGNQQELEQPETKGKPPIHRPSPCHRPSQV